MGRTPMPFYFCVTRLWVAGCQSGDPPVFRDGLPATRFLVGETFDMEIDFDD